MSVTPGARRSWQLGPDLRRLLSVASGLVLVAGFQLFVLTDHTDRWFAWTIGEPLTAATIGALYWASLVTVRFAMREATWATSRALLLGVQAFTLLTMVATVAHLGTFHLGAGPAIARIAAWAWLVVYVTVPLALLFLLANGWAGAGKTVDVPPGVPLPGWFRPPVIVLGWVIALTGLGMFVVPQWGEGAWPWALTSLTSQALGAWLVGVGITTALTGHEDDLRASRGPMVTALVLGVLLLAAVARYRDHVASDRPSAWAYVAVCVLLIAMGVTGLLLGRRLGRRATVTDSAPAAVRS